MLSPSTNLPFLVQAFFDFVDVELFGHTLAAVLETLQIFRSPPVFEIAARIELRALIVEAVSGRFCSSVSI